LAVKENIIELLNILKEDIVAEVREVCLQTLKFIEESENGNGKEEEKEEERKGKEKKDDNFKRDDKINNNKVINIINNIYNDYTPFLTEQKQIEINNAELNKLEKREKNYKGNNSIENNNSLNNLTFTKYSLENIKNNNRYNIDDNNDNNNKNLIKKRSSSSMNVESHTYNKNKIFNSINKCKSNNKRRKNKTYKANKINILNFNRISNTENNLYVNSSYNNIKKTKFTEGNNNNKRLMKSTEVRTKNNKNLSKKLSKNETNCELRKKYNKEILLLKEIERQIKAKKIKIRNAQLSIDKNKNKINLIKNNKTYIKIRIKKNKNKKNIYENKVQKENPEVSNKNIFTNNLIKNRINDQLSGKNEPNENKILLLLNNIQESQNNLLEVINNLKKTVDINYLILDKRIKELERYHDELISKEIIQNNNNNQQNEKIDESLKLEVIKNEFISGKYNEALTEAKKKDYYLYRLLPLITSENIHKIYLSILECIISELTFKLPILCKGEGNINIDIIICFFNLIIRAKIDIKPNLKIKLKNTLQLIKKEYTLKISQNDLTKIDNILKSLKV
jgi:hypothetical protein